MPESREVFKRNLYFLKKNMNVISLDDFFFYRLSSEKINVAITFDDGVKSWINIAVPILKELELPATFFVSSGFIGLTKQNEREYIRSNLLLDQTKNSRTSGCLNFNDIKMIVNEGFTIGGHTVNHRNLTKVNEENVLRYEICEDKSRLEQIVGFKISYFSYPFGAYYNSEINISEVLKECGYKGAVTTASGFNRIGSDPYRLHRELTNASMHRLVFRARIYGNSDLVTFLKNLKTSIYKGN
jgi:peptidoglycan/xylan/chitin deacetylase (PgdA/CDA1 family)